MQSRMDKYDSSNKGYERSETSYYEYPEIYNIIYPMVKKACDIYGNEVNNNVIEKIAEEILEGNISAGKLVKITAVDGKITFDSSFSVSKFCSFSVELRRIFVLFWFFAIYLSIN